MTPDALGRGGRAFPGRSYYHAPAPRLGNPVALMKTVLPTLLALAAFGVLAQETPAPPGAGGFLQAPELVESPVTGEPVEPEITIRQEGRQTITEYRVRGHLYMVRIQPQFGPPYFLVDTNGDGIIDPRDSSPRHNNINQWLLHSWQ